MSDYRGDFRSAQREFYWTLPRVVGGATVLVVGVGCGVAGVALAMIRNQAHH